MKSLVIGIGSLNKQVIKRWLEWRRIQEAKWTWAAVAFWTFWFCFLPFSLLLVSGHLILHQSRPPPEVVMGNQVAQKLGLLTNPKQ